MSKDENEMLFDEFGNPLNGDSDSSSDSDSDVSMTDEIVEDSSKSNKIILADDASMNPTLSNTFGHEVETIIATSDAKSLNDPIVQPNVVKEFMIEENTLPETSYTKQYMWELSNITERIRNVALCGNLHAGKTSILDMLIKQTHNFKDTNRSKSTKDNRLRYTDNHILEVKRGITIKSSVMSLLLPDMNHKSTVVNFIDSPGHSNFSDEMLIAARLADTVALCVDVVESVTKSLELVIEYAVKTKTRMILILTKIDRLILELRLPPLDAYYKIRRSIDQVNALITKYQNTYHDAVTDTLRLSPELNNVCFSSSIFNTIFTLESFTKKYFESNNIKPSLKVTVESFSRKLWGDIYYENKKFFTKPSNPVSSAKSRTFIKFILSPIYKMVTHTLSLDPKDRQDFFETHFKSRLKSSIYKLDFKPFLKELFLKFFGPPSLPLVSVLDTLETPIDNAVNKLEKFYTGPRDSVIAEHIKKCDPNGPLIAHITKLVDTQDSEHFYGLVRVYSGTLKQGQSVKLLGENYSINNIDDSKTQKINKCYMWCGRYKVNVKDLKAGCIGLISGPGLDNFVVKTATIFDESLTEPLFIIKGNDMLFPPVFKVAVEAYNPKDLNQFIESLKKLNRSYVGCEVKVEDNGEHSILGYGELYMDCLLHDLRILYSGIEIKVSDPMVKFNETADGTSRVKLTIHSNNNKNSVSIIAEPLEPELSSDLRSKILDIRNDSSRNIAKALRDKHKWDSFAARSVWSIGPDDLGTSILCDDTLPDEVDKNLLKEHKHAIIKGFQWAVSEGPLCNEPINDVRFKIIGIQLADEESDRNDSQLIQMIRKACHAAILIGYPKLLEPVYEIESICKSDVVNVLEKIIDRRRGHVISKDKIEGTTLWKVMGLIPVIESIGIETDLRLSTRGMAYPQLIFNKWDIVPGNPFDETVFIPLLTRVPLNATARDFMLKTRRRKGLSYEVSLSSYVSNETWNMLKELELV